MLSKLLLAAFAAGALCVAPCIDARKMTKHQMKAKQLEAANRWHNQRPIKPTSGGVQNFTFSNPKAARKYSNLCCDLTRS
jgi:carboxypeptidase D